jgi:hypothetical protein
MARLRLIAPTLLLHKAELACVLAAAPAMEVVLAHG